MKKRKSILINSNTNSILHNSPKKKEKKSENDSSSNSSTKDDIINHTFFNKYQCIKKLGEGSFGRIYEAVYKSEHFALKFEDINSNSDLLEGEARIMNYLKGPNIPLVRSFGTSGNYNILIMQLMGKSLEDLINLKKTFPIKTVCLLGYQMINVLEYIHNKHIVHFELFFHNVPLKLVLMCLFRKIICHILEKKFELFELFIILFFLIIVYCFRILLYFIWT